MVDERETPTMQQTSTDVLVHKYLEYIEKVELLAPTTVKNRKDILVPMFRVLRKPVERITLHDVDRYYIGRHHDIKASSMGLEKQCLRSFFRYCQEYLEIDMQFRWEVIKRKKDKPAKVKTFTKEQVGEVIGLCKEMQDKLVIALLFETGMRIGELLSLQITDITGTQLRIRGKGEYDRVVYMSQRLADAITHYNASLGRVVGYQFRPLQSHSNHRNDRYTSAYAVRDRIQAAFLRAGHVMYPHQLRHSMAVNWLINGGDLRSLQIILGHSNLETTQRYLQLTDTQMQEIHARTVQSVF